MNVGKIPEVVLKRSILKQIGRRRDEILVGPAVGEDCSVLTIHEDEVLVLSTDPITGTVDQIGTLAVHNTINDIASNGAQAIGIMVSILLPISAFESDLKEMMKEMESVCKDLNIQIIGGHTEVSKAVNQPIITVTGVGKIKRNHMVKTAGAKAGQEIVMTKWTGLEGTAIIAKSKEEELLGRYNASFINGAKDMIRDISVVKEAEIASQYGVSAMHDISEGGVFGALWELGVASNVGIQVDINKIPIRQETVEICEFYDLNPYKLMSAGSLLIVTDRANGLVDQLMEAKIPAKVIGQITGGKDRIIINDDEIRFVEPPKCDELYKVMQ